MAEHLLDCKGEVAVIANLDRLRDELRKSRELARELVRNAATAIQNRADMISRLERLTRREVAGFGRTLRLVREVYPDLVPEDAVDSFVGREV